MDERSRTSAPGPRFWLGGAAVALCLAILMAQTWRKWGDMLVDFGVQLYLPWKLSTGAVLYRDVAYLTGGPLSQYYHALLFRVFGVSVLTIVASNLVMLALLAALVFWCFYRMSDAWTATMAGLALALVFAFGQHGVTPGIFNYVSPYSHEIVHGLVLSIIVLWLLSRWIMEERIAPALLAGVGSGLVVLTKPEVFLALALAQAAALALFWRAKHKPVLLARSVLAMAGGAVLPPAAFFLYFIRHESLAQSVRSVLWAWTALLTSGAFDNEFYRWCLGLSAPVRHLKAMLWAAAGLAAFLGAYAALCKVKRRGWMRMILLTLAFVEGCKLSRDFDWNQCGYGLPALCLASLALLLWQAGRQGPGRAQPLPLLWSVFSLALLAKLGVWPRLWHYGFVLAMPAFLNAVYFLLWQAPSLIERAGGRAGYFRAVVSVGLLIGFAQLWQDSRFLYEQRTAWAGRGADRMLCKPALGTNEATLGRVADWIQTNTPVHCTLAVLPDGAMLNYLTRRENPTGYLRWNPAESAVYGQEKMKGAFVRAAPDYIILIDYNISQFGTRPFGQDPRDGLELKRWIDAHYRTVYETGPPAATVCQRNSLAGHSQ